LKLFIKRWTASKFSFSRNEVNINAADSRCYTLDGLPLGIELAAARCRHLDPVQLDKKMSSILNSITSGPRDYPQRQQTLRNTIQWSYDLLEPADQRLFRRLSVFSNGWSFAAMENICWNGFDEAGDPEQCLEHLSDYGLTVKLHTENEYKSHRFLQVIKEYAFEKLVEAKEEEEAKMLHCNYYQKLAQHNAEQIWIGTTSVSHLTFRDDYDNIAEALTYAMYKNDQKKTWSLINSLNALYLITGEIGFLFDWLERAGIKSDESSLEKMLADNSKYEVALSLLSAGFIRTTTGNFREGVRDLSVSRQLANETGISQLEATALLLIGITNITTGHFSEAKEVLLKSISICSEHKLMSTIVPAEITLHVVYIEEGKTEQAVNLMETAIADSYSGFMPIVQAYACYQRGYLHYYMKEYDAAGLRFRESISINTKYNLNLNASLPLLGMAMVYTELEMFDTALQSFRDSLDCLRRSGSMVEFECY